MNKRLVIGDDFTFLFKDIYLKDTEYSSKIEVSIKNILIDEFFLGLNSIKNTEAFYKYIYKEIFLVLLNNWYSNIFHLNDIKWINEYRNEKEAIGYISLMLTNILTSSRSYLYYCEKDLFSPIALFLNNDIEVDKNIFENYIERCNEARIKLIYDTQYFNTYGIFDIDKLYTMHLRYKFDNLSSVETKKAINKINHFYNEGYEVI